ncbi:MAG: alpha/beta hydrolase, partial [Bacteroidales bacterium]
SWQWYSNAPKETVSIHSYDGTSLSGIYIPSFDEKSTYTAILCHGYHSLNSDMAVIAKMYSDLGFRILMPDARGHGLSKGQFTSFGHYERYDLKRWIQYLLRTYGATDNILLHGVSMGAATVLMTSGMDLPDNVKLIVADSPYTSGWDVVARSMKPKILSLLLPGISAITFYLHRFFVGQINVLKYVKKSTIPLFIFTGEKDQITPILMAKRLLAASSATFKELYPVKEAKHAEGFILDKAGVENHIGDLLKIYFPLAKSAFPKKK